MGNSTSAFTYLISTVFDIFAFVIMLRFIMQYTRASFANPIGEIVVKATNPFLLPLRKFVPGLKGLDLAAIVLCFLVLLIKYLILKGTGIASSLPWAGTLMLALLGLIKTLFDVFFITIIVQVILSWVSPGGHPISGLLHSVTSPVLDPIKKVVPPISGFDLSPLVALLLLGFLRRLIGV